MSEEKQLIEKLDYELTESYVHDIGISKETLILFKNLIEKQQKEIKELKMITNTYNSYGGNLMNDNKIIICDSSYFLNGTFVNKFVSKDKIRAKIKDLKENNNGDDYSITNVIMILEELLEEE